MLSGFNRFLLTKAKGRTVLLLLAVTVVSFGVMAAVLTPAFQEATHGLRPFDLNFGITAEGVYRDLPSYTDRSRMIYVWFAFVDYVYPAAAAAFFALLWAWMFNKAPNRVFDRLTRAGILGVPFLFALADWLENAGFLFVIFAYPAEYPAIANLAGTLKQTKPLIELAVVALTLVFAVATVWLSRRRRHAGAADGSEAASD
jgi:hypothetical protein